jgi:hypothetical protein
MKRLLPLLTLTVFAWSYPVAARAGPVTFEFAGIIDQVDDPTNILGGTVRVGDPFSGLYTFDPTTPDSDPLAVRGLYESSVVAMSGNVGPLLYEQASGVLGLIQVRNDAPHDSYLVSSTVFLTGHPLEFFVILGDGDGLVFSDDSLPFQPFPLGGLETRSFSIADTSETLPFDLHGRISQFVPEPSTAVLLFLGMYAWRRRRLVRSPSWSIRGGVSSLFAALLGSPWFPPASMAADCNSNGIFDSTELAACRVDLVYVFDVSTSIRPALEDAICPRVESAMVDLSDEFLPGNLRTEKLRINAGGIDCACCTGGDVPTVYGTTTPWLPGSLALGDCPGTYEGEREDWGPATAVVACHKQWLADAVRFIVPVSDAAPRCGEPTHPQNGQAIADAIKFVHNNRMIVIPIPGGLDPAPGSNKMRPRSNVRQRISP